MKWTTFEVKDVLFGLVNINSIKGAISGNIYLDFRPTDSDKEDVVINSLPISHSSWQQCTANVNIYVQDIKAKVNVVSQPVPNRGRLEAITKAVIAAVDGQGGEDWVCNVVSDHTFKNDDGSHMSNVRIEFRKLN